MENKQNKTIIPTGPVLIILVGPSGSGKSTFCNTHFEFREIVSSDDIREELTGDFARQDKNDMVFKEFHHRIEFRLSAGQRVVADATHLRDADRKRTAKVGIDLNVPVYYVIINREVSDKIKTGEWRNDVVIRGKSLIQTHEDTFVSNERNILAGDFNRSISVIDTRTTDVTVATSLPRRDIASHIFHQGYDRIRVISDVHGNIGGLKAVINDIPPHTFVVFLGDVIDYGNESWECVYIIEHMVSSGRAIMVRGNHDRKMARYLEQTMAGKEFTGHVTHGMDISINQLDYMDDKERQYISMRFLSLIEQSPDWLELDTWLFVHAAAHINMFGNTTFRAHKNSYLENMALYGETDGTTNDDGYPNRTYKWIDLVPEGKNVVVGHQIMSVTEPVERKTPTGGRVIFLDTGSSKSINGVNGMLSYWDMYPTSDGRILTTEKFGNELS